MMNQTNQTPDEPHCYHDATNLESYCEPDELEFYRSQLDRYERANLEHALSALEYTFIELFKYDDARARTLLTTIGSIHDNARDLAADDLIRESTMFND